MGFADAFDYPDPAAIFAEYAAMTRFENDGARRLHVEMPPDYDSMPPTLWGGARPFADGQFQTPDGRARLVAAAPEPVAGDAARPLLLNTGRDRDHWHSMTRTGLSPRLSQHRREPLVAVHPADAGATGVCDGGLARVETASGSSVFRVAIEPGQRRGEIFVPIHWTDRMASLGRAGRLVGRARDPVSGQPGFKSTAATLLPVVPEWTGFLLSDVEPAAPPCDHWVKLRTRVGWLVELAGHGDPEALRSLLPQGPHAEVHDRSRGMLRIVALQEGAISAALFVARDASLPGRDWLIAQLAEPGTDARTLLAGRPAAPAADRGPIVCACFDVGLRTILHAVATHRLTSVEAVGTAILAGTNCGSCRPAIAGLLKSERRLVNG
jgi:assimilatory nitrate reductase catalytic subunit